MFTETMAAITSFSLGIVTGVYYSMHFRYLMYRHSEKIGQLAHNFKVDLISRVKNIAVRFGLIGTVRQVVVGRLRCITIRGDSYKMEPDTTLASTGLRYYEDGFMNGSMRTGEPPDRRIFIVDFTWLGRIWIVVLDNPSDICKLKRLSDITLTIREDFRIPRLNCVMLAPKDITKSANVTRTFNRMMGPLRRLYKTIGIQTELSSLWLALNIINSGVEEGEVPKLGRFVIQKKSTGIAKVIQVTDKIDAYGAIQSCLL